MKITKNENNTDRTIRVVVGIMILVIGLYKLTGTAQIVISIIGAIVLITGITGFCALYTLLGINTLKK